MACLIGRKLTSLSALAFMATLSACCSPGVKPGEANLFQAGCGVASGQYDEDLKAKQREVKATGDENSAELDRSMKLESILLTRQEEYQKAHSDLESLEGQNSVLEGNIEGMQVKTQKDKARKKQYLSQLHQLNGEIETLKSKLSQQANDEYLIEIEELKREVETLRKIVLGQ